MTLGTSWYEAAAAGPLAQGELVFGCPVPRVEGYRFPFDENQSIEVVYDTHELVVLSQSCDLENDKVDEVLLAAVHPYKTLVTQEGERNPTVNSTKWRKAVARGSEPAYSLLPPHDEAPVFDWSLVDFHHLFTLPKTFLVDVTSLAPVRLRLVPPYREHLAQAFARYVMRVGLPDSLVEFEGYKVS